MTSALPSAEWKSAGKFGLGRRPTVCATANWGTRVMFPEGPSGISMRALTMSIFIWALWALTAAKACSGVMPSLMPTMSRKPADDAIFLSASGLQQSPLTSSDGAADATDAADVFGGFDGDEACV